MLSVEGLAVRYGDTVAVDRVDLSVEDGESVCVLGPSGCGKTTLLRAVAGLVTPDSGRVRWDREDLAGVPPHRRGFGLMFQDHALFPHKDVLANVAFGLRMQRLPAREIALRSAEALAMVGLGGYEHRRVGELSGGERQRVALARSLAPRPRLLMLDEPLGSLDRVLRERLTVELRELFVRAGLTVLFVTHDQDEAFAVADRVAILRDGRVEQVGRPEEVWHRPATEFAARFLGYTNVTDATVRAGTATGAWGPVPAAHVPDGPVRLAARARAVRLSPGGPLSGVVESRTFRRDHFLLRVKVVDGAPVEAAVTGADVPEIGDAVTLAVDPGAVVVLPPQVPPDPGPHSGS